MALVLAMVTVAPAAFGQSAQDHFNEGMKRLAKSDWNGACAAFEKSEQPEPTMATRYQLGRCNEERGHFGTAYLMYQSAADIADKQGDTKRRDVARQRVAELEPKATKLVILVPPDRQVDGMSIKRDGTVVPKGEWNKAAVVSNGFHDVQVSAPGRKNVTMRVEAKDTGSVSKITVPALEADAGGGSNGAAPAPAPTTAPTSSSTSVPPAYGTTPTADAGPAMERKNPAMFWSGMGLIIGGALAGAAGAGLYGLAAQNGDPGQGTALPVPPGSIASWTIAVALIATGIPLMVIGGRKVPAGAPAAEAASLVLDVSPVGVGLRASF